jgi:hypothetical protein
LPDLDKEAEEHKKSVETEETLWWADLVIEELTKISRSMITTSCYFHALRLPFRRCVFRSKEGYVGLGPANLLVANVLYTFLGANVPFVISSVNAADEGGECMDCG